MVLKLLPPKGQLELKAVCPVLHITFDAYARLTLLPLRVLLLFFIVSTREREREKCFYLTTHSTHFIYGYMASDIWLRTILIVRKETRCRHIGYSYRLTARVLLYAPSHRQDSTYHGLCYTSRVALAGARNSSMGPPHRFHLQVERNGAVVNKFHSVKSVLKD